MAQPDGQNAADTNALPAQPDTAADAALSANNPLLCVIRKLISYGWQMYKALQEPDGASRAKEITRGMFGPVSLALILARITRGLRLAAALEERVGATAARPAKPAAAAPAKPARTHARATPRKPSTAPTVPLPSDTAQALLARMPTAKEIAAQIRRRPVALVIADICADLGIGVNHPLWHEVQAALKGLKDKESAFKRLQMEILRRVTLVMQALRSGELKLPPPVALPKPAAAGAGPPSG